MKKLILILTLLTTFVLTSTAQQEPATPLGNKNSAMRHLGRLYVDSVFYPPLMDYLFGEGQLWRGGAIQSMYTTGNTGPSLPYYWTGTEWKRFILDGDIPPTALPLNEIAVGNGLGNPLKSSPVLKVNTYGGLDIDMQTWNGSSWALNLTGYANFAGVRINGSEPKRMIYAPNQNLGFAVGWGKEILFTLQDETTVGKFAESGFQTTLPITIGNRATDTLGSNGTAYYNTTSNKFRGYVAGAWQNFATEDAVANLLQTGRIIYVDANNPNSTDSRTGLIKYSLTAPFKTIAAALTAFNKHEKDVVYVRPGTYNENVVFSDVDLTMILDNVVWNGGAGPAIHFSGPGFGDITVYLINATIYNTGTTGTDDPNTGLSSALLARQLDKFKLFGNSKSTCVLSSVNSAGIGTASIGNLTVQNVTAASTNFDAFHSLYGGSTTEKAEFFASRFNGPVYRQILAADQCEFITTGRPYAIRSGHYDIRNSRIQNSDGYALRVFGWEYNYNSIILHNNHITARDGLAYMDAGVGPLVYQYYVSQNNITVTNGAAMINPGGPFIYDNNWIGSGSTFKFTNTVSNVPLMTPTNRARYWGAYIKESNTQTNDSTVFFGIRTGFGTPSPTANVHINGTAKFEVGAGTLGATDSVFVEDEATGNVKKVANTAFGGGGTSTPPSATPTTLANFNSLYTSKTLVANTTYKITDRPGGDLYITAANDSVINPRVVRSMLVPTTYAQTTDAVGNSWLGIWTPLLEPAPNSLAIWGARVWKNLTGSVGSFVDEYTLDNTNWQLISPSSFTNREYTLQFFECEYDLANDWISKQYDGNGNAIGYDYAFATNMVGATYNPCDYTDWNLGTTGQPFFNNHVWQVLNNVTTMLGIFNNHGGAITRNRCAYIEDNLTTWGITNNVLPGQIELNIASQIGENLITEAVAGDGGAIMWNTTTGSIYANTLQGFIQHNKCADITSNSNTKSVQYNTNSGSISGNSNGQVIEWNKNNGGITNNTISGYISHNSNNGDINQNNGTGNIHHNTNNGNIGNATRAADVTDTIVNK